MTARALGACAAITLSPIVAGRALVALGIRGHPAQTLVVVTAVAAVCAAVALGQRRGA